MREGLMDSNVPNAFEADDMKFTLSTSEIVELANFWSDVRSGQPLQLDTLSGIIEIFVKGLEDPSVQADALGSLMSPECADLLDGVFDQTWSPDLNAELKDSLIDIALEPDEEVRIRDLCNLLLEQENEAEPFQGFPSSDGAGRDVLNARIKESSTDSKDSRAGELHYGDDPHRDAFNKINKAYSQEDDLEVLNLLQQTPQLEAVLQAGGSESWALLIDLADHHDFGEMACQLLFEAGSDIVPILDEFAPADSQARDVIEWILTGSPPGFGSESFLNSLITQAIASGNAESLIEVIEQTTSRASLVKTLVAAGDAASPILVELLGNPDRSIQVVAMDALYAQGSDAVGDLVLAKVHADPVIRNNAQVLLHAHFTGESGWENVEMNYQYASPFSDLRLGGNGNNSSISTSEFLLDPTDLLERLINSETHLGAVNSLVQIGQPGVPLLCQAIINSRRKNRGLY